MNPAIIAPILDAILQILGDVGPALGSSSIDKIITMLVGLLPTVINEATDLVPMVKNIINALSAHPAASADQLAQLKELDAKCDADFDAEAAQIPE